MLRYGFGLQRLSCYPPNESDMAKSSQEMTSIVPVVPERTGAHDASVFEAAFALVPQQEPAPSDVENEADEDRPL